MKRFRSHFFTIFIFLHSIFLSSIVKANELDNARFTLRETFGVHTEKEDGGYRVTTFVPRTFLLFNVNESEPELKVGTNYIAATTQDGVRIFIFHS